jgi:hypothetical protein
LVLAKDLAKEVQLLTEIGNFNQKSSFQRLSAAGPIKSSNVVIFTTEVDFALLEVMIRAAGLIESPALIISEGDDDELSLKGTMMTNRFTRARASPFGCMNGFYHDYSSACKRMKGK